MTGWPLIRHPDASRPLRRPRRPGRRRADRRDRRPVQHGHGRLLPGSGSDRRQRSATAGCIPATWPTIDEPGLRADQGPLQGHHHPWRREHLLGRGRERHHGPSGRPGVRGGFGARQGARRGAGGTGRPQAGRDGHRAGSCANTASERLARFKVPRDIHFRESLPKGGTGKILKAELREPFWKGHDARVQ